VSLVLTRRAAADVGRRQERSESYGFIRWAAEIALSDAVVRQRAGLQILAALVRSPLIDQADADLAFAIARAVTGEEELRS
jgi:hypothetical protein